MLNCLEQDVLKKELQTAVQRVVDLEQGIDKFTGSINTTPPWGSSAHMFHVHFERLIACRNKEVGDA